jgi:hypothetical protein
MNVSVEQEEKTNYELGPGFTKNARSRHHVEKVMSRILAKQLTHSKTIPPWRTEPEDSETDDRWH